MNDLKFIEPIKKITTKKDLDLFLHSQTCNDIISFAERLSESVKGKPNSSNPHTSKVRN